MKAHFCIVFLFLFNLLFHSRVLNAQNSTIDATFETSFFAKKLLFRIADKRIAEIVFESYRTHLAQFAKDDISMEIPIQWLIYSALFKLGSSHYEFRVPFWEFPELDSLDPSDFEAAFQAFREQVINESKRNFASATKTPSEKKRVSIITAPHNGGHISPAKALKEELEGEFEVQLVDEHEVLCAEADKRGLKIWQCGYGLPPLFAFGVYNMDWESFDFSPFTSLPYVREMKTNLYGIIREKIAEFGADFIISTLHHVESLTVMAHFMDLPMAIVVTDYGFPPTQWHAMDDVRYPSISYWTPSKDRNLFRRMLQEFELEGPAFNWTAHFRSALIKTKLFESKLEFEALLPELEVFKLTGFPIAKIFEKEISEEEANLARQQLKLNTDPERKNIALSYGVGVDDESIKTFLEKAIAYKNSLNSKIQLLVLTGKNKSLYEELESFLTEKGIPVMTDASYAQNKDKQFDEKIIARVLPLVSYPTDIANLYKITDLLLSKSGGATSSEIVATETPYLRVFGLSHWELENIKYLESVGLSRVAKKFQTKENPLEENLSFYEEPVDYDELLETLNGFLLEKPKVKREKVLSFDRTRVRKLIHQTIEDYRK